jgi:hypothetical protein
MKFGGESWISVFLHLVDVGFEAAYRSVVFFKSVEIAHQFQIFLGSHTRMVARLRQRAFV